MFKPINLDDLSNDPADFKLAADTLEKLAEYANLKACAGEARLQGRIKTALLAEQKADAIYVALPTWAQW